MKANEILNKIKNIVGEKVELSEEKESETISQHRAVQCQVEGVEDP